MKKITLFLFLFFSTFTIGQITLENTYNEGVITRVNLENSGEKYYLLKQNTNELKLYNPDHSLWKTIVLPAIQPSEFYNTRIFHVSENKINPDSNLEIVFSSYDSNTNSFNCKVFSENGMVLLTIFDVFEARISEIEGLSTKLIAKKTFNNIKTVVYSLPELIQENEYLGEDITRVNLENSDEKYYSLNTTNNNLKIYNQNHTIWKTIVLTKPTNATYNSISFISETKINSDSLLEIGYSYYTATDVIYIYEHTGKVINENNVEIMTIPNAIKFSIDSIVGLDDKLMVRLRNDSISDYDLDYLNVYEIPSLNLEHSYESLMLRTKLENSGEKYYTSENPIGGFAKIYNSDHTLWKSIFLDLPNEMELNTTINFISETKIHPDEFIELSYSYSYNSILMFTVKYSQIMNENGLSYLAVNNASSIYLSEIPNLNSKLIGVIENGDAFNNEINYDGTVYNYDALSTANFNNIFPINIAPNPATICINIASKIDIVEANIYNTIGALVKQVASKSITKIDVEKLPTGVYILQLIDANNKKTTHKITISH